MSNVQANSAGIALSNAIADAVDRAGAYTVQVDARRRIPLSGIVFQADLILTANHGVEREEDIRIGLGNGSTSAATIAGRDPGTDLVVLRLSETRGLAAAAPAGQEARVGNLVVAVGRPSEDGLQASLGLVNAFGSNFRTRQGGVLNNYLVTDATPLPGFSGGPLIDLAGGLLAINTSGLARGVLLSIPARQAIEIAKNLAEHGHVRRGYLGIRSQMVEIPTQVRTATERDQATGLLVMGVEADGPASGGLMVGDILVGMNGQPVVDHDDLMAHLIGEIVGRAADIQILRGGQLQTVQVTVGERKES